MTATETIQRQDATFQSGGERCAAWHYPGTSGVCVLMAGGLAVTKEPATDRFAARFHAAGHSVLAFDFRRLGASGGTPRQVVSVGDQQADYGAAIAFARTLPEVERVVIWGFSLAGGHVFAVAAQTPDLAGAIAVSPLADGAVSAPNAFRHMTPLSLVRLQARAARDLAGSVLGREPLLIPLAGRRGEVAALTTPDSLNGPSTLNPGNRYPDWRQAVAAHSALRMGLYRPARHASRIRCPLLVVVSGSDGVAPPRPAIRAARRAPDGELVTLRGGHYAPLLDQHERAVAAQLDFLSRV